MRAYRGKILLIGRLGDDPTGRIYDEPAVGNVFRAIPCHSRAGNCQVSNEATLASGENIGGTASESASCESVGGTTAAPEASGDDGGGGGDPDPEPERRRPGRPRKTCNTPPAGNPPAPSAAQAADALIQFDTRPASSFVRLPVVCGLYSCSPATAWRWVKAGKIPAPVKLSDRVTAWRVGDLRESLAQLAA